MGLSRWVLLQHTAAVISGSPFTAQVIVLVFHSGRRPGFGVFPLTASHYKITDLWRFINSIFKVLKPVIEPADHNIREIHLCGWTEIDSSYGLGSESHMVPGTDHQLSFRTGYIAASVLLHTRDMPHRAVAVVIPPTEVKVGYLHLFMKLGEPPWLPGRIFEPGMGVFSQSGRQIPDNINPGQEFQPPAVFDVLPDGTCRLGGMRRWPSVAPAQVRCHSGHPPFDAACRSERTPPVHLGQLKRDRVGTHGCKVRRPQSGQDPLHPGIVGSAEGTYSAVAPGLSRQPFDTVVSVFAIARVVFGKRNVVPVGGVAAAAVLRDHGIAGTDVAVESAGWFPVGGSEQ